VQEVNMVRWFLRGRLAAWERAWGYDAAYAREILDADVLAFLAFGLVAVFGAWARDTPKSALYAARIASAMSEDCGPCTQLVVDMASKDGVPAEVLAQIVRGNPQDPDAALGVRFARDPDAVRDEIRRRWGPRALVSLAFAVTTARIFPTVKRSLGHARACRRVVVAGAPVAVEVRAEE
jgi:hypothetical protein